MARSHGCLCRGLAVLSALGMSCSLGCFGWGGTLAMPATALASQSYKSEPSAFVMALAALWEEGPAHGGCPQQFLEEPLRGKSWGQTSGGCAGCPSETPTTAESCRQDQWSGSERGKTAACPGL